MDDISAAAPPVSYGGGAGYAPEAPGAQTEDDSEASFIHRMGGFVICILVGSAIELIAALDFCVQFQCRSGNFAYAVAVGVVGVLAGGWYTIMERKGGVNPKMAYFFSIFIFLWWGMGVGVLTFDGPFTTLSNGYIGCWVAGFGACAMLHEEVEHVRQKAQNFRDRIELDGHTAACQTALLICSIVVTWEASEVCANQRGPSGGGGSGSGGFFPSGGFGRRLQQDPGGGGGGGCSGENAYAVSVGVISLVLAIIMHVPAAAAALKPHAKPVGAFLGAWWVAGLAVLTFRAPFQQPGNGFFATWGGAVSAMVLAYDAFNNAAAA